MVKFCLNYYWRAQKTRLSFLTLRFLIARDPLYASFAFGPSWACSVFDALFSLGYGRQPQIHICMLGSDSVPGSIIFNALKQNHIGELATAGIDARSSLARGAGTDYIAAPAALIYHCRISLHPSRRRQAHWWARSSRYRCTPRLSSRWHQIGAMLASSGSRRFFHRAHRDAMNTRFVHSIPDSNPDSARPLHLPRPP
jgi:hypothetical protein